MEKLSSLWSSIRSKSTRWRLVLLCKIFIIWLLLQFFLQTFITFQLGRDWKFWTLFWMWKEFILLIFVIILLRYILSNLKWWTKAIKNKEHTKEITRKLLLKNIQSKFIIQFLLIFVITCIVFLLLAIWLQHVWIKAFVLSAKYDLLWFFIFWIWVCLAILFFKEEDEDIIELYNKLIIRSLWLWLFRWLLWMLDMLPSLLKYFWFDPNSFEWTVWANPPAAYYTKIKPFYEGSYVRNTYLFERPTSFWFWLTAFFPVFALWFLRKKKWIDQLFPTIFFWALILSTWSRAWMAVRALEGIVLFFIIYRKPLKKYFIPLLILALVWLWWVAYLWRWIMVREHSNTGHLELMKAWRNITKENLVLWRGAWYSGPASHQLCYRSSENATIEDVRCLTIKQTNDDIQITTYWFNPESQYIQILMEYWIIGILFWLWICGLILFYTAKMIFKYRRKTKSPYQELLYYTLLWFWIWFIWLCAEGLVLHSLADRMIIYPFFLLYWITVWLREKEKDKQYIPAVKKKKLRKNNKDKRKSKKAKSNSSNN